MNKFFQIFFFRIISRTIGLYSRFLFFKLIQKERSLQSLSNEYKDLYKDYGYALNQDFMNGLVGTIVFILIILISINIFS